MWKKFSATVRRRATVLSATLLLTVSLLIGAFAMPAGAAPTTLAERVEQAVSQTVVSNTSRASDFASTVKSKIGGSYTVSVSDWYIVKAVSGCKDKEEVLFEGYDGFASGTLNVSGGGENVVYPFTVKIRPGMMSYTFASTARCDYFYPDPDNPEMLRGDVPGTTEYFTLSKDGKNLVGYSGSAEKIVIPEGVVTMDQSWWLDTDLAAVRCLVLPDSLTTLPDQFAVPFSQNIEVIIMGDNVTKAEGRHTFWKCWRLKNLRLSDNLENLTEEALFESISLGELKLPSKLKVIEKGALHLSALRDYVLPASVTDIAQETFCWPMRKAGYVAVGTRTQGNAVPVEITDEVDPYLHTLVFGSDGQPLPLTITILSQNAAYDTLQKNYWNTGYSWSPINIHYISGSTTGELVDSGYKPENVTYTVINMQPQQIRGHATVALETMPITSATTANGISSYLKEKIHSEKSVSVTVSDYTYTAPSADADGSAKAQIEIKCGDDTVSLNLDRTLKNHPHFETGAERREPIIKPGEKDKEEVKSEYVSAALLTDRDEYSANEDIFVTLKLGNISTLNLNSIRVNFNVPDELSVKSGSPTPVNFDLAPEEETKKELTLIEKVSLEGKVVNGVTVRQSEASGKNTNLLKIGREHPVATVICGAIVLLCVAAIVYLSTRKNMKRRGIAVMLCALILIGAAAFPLVRTVAASERITVTKRITVDGERYNLTASVSFTLSEEAENDNDNNYTVDWNLNG